MDLPQLSKAFQRTWLWRASSRCIFSYAREFPLAAHRNWVPSAKKNSTTRGRCSISIGCSSVRRSWASSRQLRLWCCHSRPHFRIDFFDVLWIAALFVDTFSRFPLSRFGIQPNIDVALKSEFKRRHDFSIDDLRSFRCCWSRVLLRT